MDDPHLGSQLRTYYDFHLNHRHQDVFKLFADLQSAAFSLGPAIFAEFFPTAQDKTPRQIGSLTFSSPFQQRMILFFYHRFVFRFTLSYVQHVSTYSP